MRIIEEISITIWVITVVLAAAVGALIGLELYVTGSATIVDQVEMEITNDSGK